MSGTHTYDPAGDIIPASPTCAHPNYSVDGDGNIGPGYGEILVPATPAVEPEPVVEPVVEEPEPAPAEVSGKHKKTDTETRGA